MNLECKVPFVLLPLIVNVAMSATCVARACEPSAWNLVVTPFLRCLEVRQEEESSIDIHNACSEQVELIPVKCGGPCSEAIHLAPNETHLLMVPRSPEDGDERIFSYKMSEQTGALTARYEAFICDDDGGCNAASAQNRSRFPRVGLLVFFLTILGLAFRRRRWVSKCNS
jgi:hypothetical protein